MKMANRLIVGLLMVMVSGIAGMGDASAGGFDSNDVGPTTCHVDAVKAVNKFMGGDVTQLSIEKTVVIEFPDKATQRDYEIHRVTISVNSQEHGSHLLHVLLTRWPKSKKCEWIRTKAYMSVYS